MKPFRTKFVFAFFAGILCVQSVNGQEDEQMKLQGINLPVVDLDGKVTSIAGMVFDREGVRQSYKLELGSEAFGVRISENPTNVSQAPLINLINHPSIEKELMLSDEQQSKIKQIRVEGRKAIQEAAKEISLNQLNADGSRATTENLGKIAENQDHLLREVLLPHQIKRLQEISFQALVLDYGIIQVLKSTITGKEFGIDDEQLQSLKKEGERIEKKLAEDIERLKVRANEELLGHLTSDQKAKFNDFHGEPFRATKADWER